MPSFQTESPLDYRVKKGLLVDCFKTLDLSMKRKRKYKRDKMARMTDRLMSKKPTDPASKSATVGDERKTEFVKIENQSNNE